MAHKRSYHQREDAPWLLYPERQVSFSRSNNHTHSNHSDRTRSSASLTSLSSYTSASSAGSSSRSTASTPPPTHKGTASSSASSGQPRSLSEELAMALQGSPSPSEETSISSPPSSLASPTELMSSPQDLPSPSGSVHFPLLKPRNGSSSSSSSTTSSSGRSNKPRPSPLSLNNAPPLRKATTDSSDARPSQGGSSDVTVDRNPTLAHDTAISSELEAASAAMTALTLDDAPPLVRRSGSNATGSRRASQSLSRSATCSETSSPKTASPSCSAFCARQSHSHHHPHCPHHHVDQFSSRHSSSTSLDRNNPRQHHYHLPSCQYYDPTKADRPTKGVSRLGVPHMSFFTPSVASSEPNSPTTRSDSPVPLTRDLTGPTSEYDLSASKTAEGTINDHEDHTNDDKEQVGGQLRLYSSEPEPKKRRSRASMLLDVAVESLFYTGAFALAAYNLVTGKGRQLSDGGENTSHAETNDSTEEKVTFAPTTTLTTSPRTVRTSHHRSASTGHSARYHKARTPRSYKARQHHHHHHHSSHNHHYQHGHHYRSGTSSGSGSMQHSRSHSMSNIPTRPGPEERDEQFLRMEAQLSSLIAEGKRALNSRIEIWDE
ncbi:hypothetical protein BGW41_007646 [Actinomortierella wolfii]|nr:hypothetical protein BGW41_007646 [Actinomortierella wolfii]